MNIDCYFAIFSLTNISSHRWVFQKIPNCCFANYAGPASLDISLYNKQHSFPKASAHKIWPVYLRWIEKIHLIIIEITCCICMCNGCLCITAAFICRKWPIVIIENAQNVFSYSVSSVLDREVNTWSYVLLKIMNPFVCSVMAELCLCLQTIFVRR